MKLKLIFILAVGFLILGNSCKRGSDNSTNAIDNSTIGQVLLDSFKLDTSQSIIYWSGGSPSGPHNGSLKFKSGILYGNQLQIQTANLWMDMNSIQNLDIEDATDRENLESHLKNEDFFQVDKFPEATFYVHKMEVIKDSITNAIISGILTIKGVSNPLVIYGKIDYSNEGIMVTVPEFSIDRTMYNIMYSSKKILASLKDGYIYDEINLSLKIIALKY